MPCLLHEMQSRHAEPGNDAWRAIAIADACLMTGAAGILVCKVGALASHLRCNLLKPICEAPGPNSVYSGAFDEMLTESERGAGFTVAYSTSGMLWQYCRATPAGNHHDAWQACLSVSMCPVSCMSLEVRGSNFSAGKNGAGLRFRFSLGYLLRWGKE